MLTRTKVGMGTFISISLDENNSKQVENCFNIFKDVEHSLSSYDYDAQIFKLNKNKKIEMDSYTYQALKLSEKYYAQTDGYFNIAIGSITKDLYRFGEDEHLPSEQKLQKANVDFRGLSFDTKKAYLNKNMKLDLGGMGKGFGVDKVVQYLKTQNITKAIISASGDIRCLGICHINIQNPYDDSFLASFDTSKDEMGISTSGNYNRYVTSTKNNHLINPKLKKSAQNFTSITLISDISNSDLDAYATAVSVMPKEQAYQFLDSMHLAYIILQSDKQLVISKNIDAFIKNLRTSY
jgi:thiamine biosynthesis lipoprotein